MSATFKWCKDRTRLSIWDKQVFIVNCNGVKYWYLNGNIHRKNGPAMELPSGTTIWYLDGKYHRVNGPAVEYTNGVKRWYLGGYLYSESDYWNELNK